MYSQQDEERVILEHIGSGPGRFYDIGAFDGKTFSNTLCLLERGWSGVMVEPSPAAFVGLVTNTEPHKDRVQLVNAAVAVEGGLAKWWDFGGDAISTLDAAHKDKWQAAGAATAREFAVNVLPIADLFEAYGPAEFINLDVEGTSWTLWSKMPLAWPELKLLCIEHDRHDAEIATEASAHGFKQVMCNGTNIILVRC